MTKPKGGRGQKAPYQTKLMRVPVPLEQQVNELVERYQKYLDLEGQENANNPPHLLDADQQKFLQLFTAIKKLVNKINAGESGYKANSFSQGIKHLKEIIATTKLVNK